MPNKKWSKGVHPERGGLHDWAEKQPARTRHRHLTETVNADGYATAVRRLDFIANVANRSNNPGLHRVVRADLKWLERTYGNKDIRRD